ncbi:MAG: DUF4034 domain-containing protein, partial [Candidatus Firestonebacteria bacterium]|nr:DUF4034 domain-containing protein [Candidatus Firestonebacteria bacterium]
SGNYKIGETAQVCSGSTFKIKIDYDVTQGCELSLYRGRPDTDSSSRIANTISSIFFPKFGYCNILSNLKDIKLDGTENISGEECYIISCSSSISKKEIFWISAENKLIIKYHHSFEDPDNKTESHEEFDSTISKTNIVLIQTILEQALEKEGIKTKGEDDKKNIEDFVNAMKQISKMIKITGFSEETYSNIHSPQLSDKDFEFNFPEGTVLKEDPFTDMFNNLQFKLKGKEYISEYFSLLKEKKFDDFEKKFGEIQKDFRKNEEKVTDIYVYIAKEENILPILDEWCGKKPNSYMAFTARGLFYIKYAWEARGGDWAKNVKEDAWKPFFERLNLAKQNLEKAYSLNPDVPYAASYLIIVAKGIGSRMEKNHHSYMEDYFQKALKSDPYNYSVHSHKLDFLFPKWHGKSFEEVFKYVRTVLKKIPENKKLRDILIEAQDEMFDRGNFEADYLGEKVFWEEIKEVYDEWIKEEPENKEIKRNYFMIAMLAKKYDIVSEDFFNNKMAYTSPNKTFEQKLAESYLDYKIYGYSLYGIKLYDDAINLFNEILKTNKDDSLY